MLWQEMLRRTVNEIDLLSWIHERIAAAEVDKDMDIVEDKKGSRYILVEEGVREDIPSRTLEWEPSAVVDQSKQQRN